MHSRPKFHLPSTYLAAVFLSAAFLWSPARLVQAAPAASSTKSRDVVIHVSEKAMAAVTALGPDIAFFTSKRNPLQSLSEIKTSGTEVGAWGMELLDGIKKLVLAGGGEYGAGGKGLARVIGDGNFEGLFTENPELRFFVTHKYDDHREDVIAGKGGGARVVFQLEGTEAPAARAVLAAGDEDAKPARDTTAKAFKGMATCPGMTITTSFIYDKSAGTVRDFSATHACKGGGGSVSWDPEVGTSVAGNGEFSFESRGVQVRGSIRGANASGTITRQIAVECKGKFIDTCTRWQAKEEKAR